MYLICTKPLYKYIYMYMYMYMYVCMYVCTYLICTKPLYMFWVGEPRQFFQPSRGKARVGSLGQVGNA